MSDLKDMSIKLLLDAITGRFCVDQTLGDCEAELLRKIGDLEQKVTDGQKAIAAMEKVLRDWPYVLKIGKIVDDYQAKEDK